MWPGDNRSRLTIAAMLVPRFADLAVCQTSVRVNPELVQHVLNWTGKGALHVATMVE